MNYLLDTNHWIHLQRGHPEILARIQSVPPHARFYMPVVAQGELLVGIELAASARRRTEIRALYEQIMRDTADVLPVTPRVAEEYAIVFAALRRKGRPIETNDIWIAATALAYDLILVSSDQHFQYVDGLTVEDWTHP